MAKRSRGSFQTLRGRISTGVSLFEKRTSRDSQFPDSLLFLSSPQHLCLRSTLPQLFRRGVGVLESHGSKMEGSFFPRRVFALPFLSSTRRPLFRSRLLVLRRRWNLEVRAGKSDVSRSRCVRMPVDLRSFTLPSALSPTSSTPSGAVDSRFGSSSLKRQIFSSTSRIRISLSTREWVVFRFSVRVRNVADSSAPLFQDLNHRKLTYDCQAPSTTPFDQAIGSLGERFAASLRLQVSSFLRLTFPFAFTTTFPASAAGAPPVLSLRTIKSDGKLISSSVPLERTPS